MIPTAYFNFFTTLAGVEATLFGLIFVVITIAPADAISSEASIERQVNVLTSYGAMLNPLIISLFALLPGEQIGLVSAGLSFIGLANSIVMLLNLRHHLIEKKGRLRNTLFMMVGIGLYTAEAVASIDLYRKPANSTALLLVSEILILLSVFGVARAWDLVGIRRFNLRRLINPSDPSDPSEH